MDGSVLLDDPNAYLGRVLKGRGVPNHGLSVCTMRPFRVLFIRSEWTAGGRAPLAARRAGPDGLQTGLRTLNCITTDV